MVLNDGQTITANENELTNLSFSKSDFSLRDIETNTTTFIKTVIITMIIVFITRVIRIILLITFNYNSNNDIGNL